MAEFRKGESHTHAVRTELMGHRPRQWRWHGCFEIYLHKYHLIGFTKFAYRLTRNGSVTMTTVQQHCLVRISVDTYRHVTIFS